MSGLFAIISPDFFKGVIFIKLHKSQLILIRHLIRFNVLDYESCLELLDIENTNDKIAMSYMFRPLTKYNYISKNKNGCVTVLKKGKALFPNEHMYITAGSSEQTKQRVIQVSRIAASMEKLGIRNTDKLLDNTDQYFIPSACWRNIAPGILSTTRFVGMLIAYNKKYAVYDIGDGSMEWQIRAESSLFYTKFGDYETKADGMIMICDSGKRNAIAENIIRHTMWNRKSLLNGQYTERERPVRFSRSPIKLRTQYERVYLIIEYTWGGEGDYFNLPDMRGKMPIGVDEEDNDFNAVGKIGGSKEITLAVKNLPPHKHSIYIAGGNSQAYRFNYADTTANTDSISWTTDGKEAGLESKPFNSMNPYAIGIFVIKAVEVPTVDDIGIPADQTYDPESENAQSGKAVAQAVASKMDTFGTVTTEPDVKSVTVTDEDENISNFRFIIPSYMTGWFEAGQLILHGQGGGLILRSGTGDIDCENSHLINISDPINANDAANKQYVDGLVGDISAALDELHTYAQALINGGGA